VHQVGFSLHKGLTSTDQQPKKLNTQQHYRYTSNLLARPHNQHFNITTPQMPRYWRNSYRSSRVLCWVECVYRQLVRGTLLII